MSVKHNKIIFGPSIYPLKLTKIFIVFSSGAWMYLFYWQLLMSRCEYCISCTKKG